LKLGHVVNLMTALENIEPFLYGGDRIAIEICGALFELRKVFDRAESALRAEQPLYVYAPQRGSLDPTAILLRPYITDQVHGPGRVTVDVTIEAGHSQHTFRFLGFAVRGGIELLLRKLRHEHAQPIELFRVKNAVEQLVEIVDRY
jgi:hypothetical protein